MNARAHGHRGNDADPQELAPLLPHSVEAEQAVLGALLLGGSWDQVAKLLRVDDFYRADHRLIFAAIGALAGEGEPCDAVLASEWLQRTGQIGGTGGLAYLGKLANETASTANIQAYAKVVREKSILREISALGPDVERAIADGSSSTDLLERTRSTLERLQSTLPEARPAEPLDTQPVSTWSSKPSPAPRDWILEGLIPARRVTSFLANGGLGKTTIAVQIGVHVAMNRPLYGLNVSGGAVLGLFCEDEQDELHRRVSAVCAAEGLELEQLDRFIAVSREGIDSVLCTFERDRMELTTFYQQLDATVAAHQPRLLILDTAADLFVGDFMSTPHVRQFIKVALGGLCVRHGCAVLLIAHPSASGMASGDGGGFSTAWNNAVRSRLYLRKPKTEDPEAAQDRRVLEVMKSNYAASGVTVPLLWQHGAFVPDPEPVEEGTVAKRVPKVDTDLAIAIREYFSTHAPGGAVVKFQALFTTLKASGAIPEGPVETLRKRVRRSLRELESAGVIAPTQVPRGSYRLLEVSGHWDKSRDNSGTLGRSGHGTFGTPLRGEGVSCPEVSPVNVPDGSGSEISTEATTGRPSPWP